MVLNTYVTTKKKHPLIKHGDLCARIHQTLGVGIKMVYKIVSEATRTNTLTDNQNPNHHHSRIFDKMTKETKDRIRHEVHKLMKELPEDTTADGKYVTVAKIFERISSISEMPKMCKRTLYNVLKLLGFW